MKKGDILFVNAGAKFDLVEVENVEGEMVYASNGLHKGVELKKKNCSVVCYKEDYEGCEGYVGNESMKEDLYKADIGDIIFLLKGNMNKVFEVDEVRGDEILLSNGYIKIELEKDACVMVCKAEDRKDNAPVLIKERIIDKNNCINLNGDYCKLLHLIHRVKCDFNGDNKWDDEKTVEFETKLRKLLKNESEATKRSKYSILKEWEEKRDIGVGPYYTQKYRSVVV